MYWIDNLFRMPYIDSSIYWADFCVAGLIVLFIIFSDKIPNPAWFFFIWKNCSIHKLERFYKYNNEWRWY